MQFLSRGILQKDLRLKLFAKYILPAFFNRCARANQCNQKSSQVHPKLTEEEFMNYFYI